MKRLSCLLLGILLVFSLCACQQAAPSSGEAPDQQAITEEATEYFNQMMDGDFETFFNALPQVPYKAGTISAVAYGQDGQKISEEKLNGRTSVTTTGEKKNLKATVDRDTIASDGADLTYVTVDVTDKDGNIIPNAEWNLPSEGSALSACRSS